MTAAGTFPDAWKEVCLIGIIPSGGSETQWAGMTEDITAFDWGEKDIEGLALVNGGRVVKTPPMGDEGITFKIYPVDAALGAAGAIQWFHPQATEDSEQPLVVDNTRTRTLHRLILLWAETLPATAGTQPAISKAAYRIQIVNAYMTAYKPSFDDKVFSAEVTFKWAPFNKAATANKREESTSGTAQLAAVGTSATSLAA